MLDKYKYKLLIIGLIMLLFVILSQLQDVFNWWNDFEMWSQKFSPAQERGAKTLNIGAFVGRATPLMYYTIQSNIIAASILISLFFIKNEKIKSRLFTIGCSYMILLFFGFWVFLAPFWPWNWLWMSTENIFLHGVSPIVFFVLWFKYSGKNTDKIRTILYSLVFPICYYIFVWVFYLSIHGQAAIYPFIDFYNPWFLGIQNHFYIVLLNIATFVGFLFIITGFSYAAIQVKQWSHNRRKRLKKNIDIMSNS